MEGLCNFFDQIKHWATAATFVLTFFIFFATSGLAIFGNFDVFKKFFFVFFLLLFVFFLFTHFR